jgi:flagellar basal-body rod protein FlgF
MNGLYVAASGLAAEMAKLGGESSNLANIWTPGFRRFEIIAQAGKSGSSPYQYATTPSEPVLAAMPGPSQDTGDPLDIYVSGDAYLAVQNQNGDELYTRDGALRVAPTADDPNMGTLYAADRPLLKDDGTQFLLPKGGITISPNGIVSVGTVSYGKIKLVDPAGERMVAAGGSLYRTASGNALPISDQAGVRQGFLEMSSGNVVGDMVSVLESARQYENSLSAFHMIDENWNQANQALALNVNA